MTIQEREAKEFAKFQKRAEKQLKPIFKQALAISIEPVIKWIDKFGINNVPVEDLIKKNVWEPAYINSYDIVGVGAAKNEYYKQKRSEPSKKDDDFFTSIGSYISEWREYLRTKAITYSNLMDGKLNETTVNIINSILGGISVDEQNATKLARDEIINRMYNRTLTLSRTESTTIANIGKEEGAKSWIKEQGGQGYKSWIGRVVKERPEHLDLNGVILPIEDSYDMDGHECMRPGDETLPPELRINCRCTQTLMTQNRYNQYINRGLIIGGKIVG